MPRSMIEMIDYCIDLREEFRLRSIWSADNFDAPTDAHPFEGTTELLYWSHWGPKPVRVTIEGPTYRDLWEAAEDAINASGDDHHIFIEAFRFNKEGELEMITGS